MWAVDLGTVTFVAAGILEIPFLFLSFGPTMLFLVLAIALDLSGFGSKMSRMTLLCLLSCGSRRCCSSLLSSIGIVLVASFVLPLVIAVLVGLHLGVPPIGFVLCLPSVLAFVGVRLPRHFL